MGVLLCFDVTSAESFESECLADESCLSVCMMFVVRRFILVGEFRAARVFRFVQGVSGQQDGSEDEASYKLPQG